MTPYLTRPVPNTTSAGEAGGSAFYACGSHSHPVPQCPIWPIEEECNNATLDTVFDSTTRMYLKPFYLPGPLKLAKIYGRVTTAGAGQTLKVALYGADGQAVIEGSWSIDVSSTGRKSATFPVVRELPVGFYWYGFVVNQTGVSWGMRVTASSVGVSPLQGYVTIASANTPPDVFDPRAVVATENNNRPFIQLAAY